MSSGFFLGQFAPKKNGGILMNNDRVDIDMYDEVDLLDDGYIWFLFTVEDAMGEDIKGSDCIYVPYHNHLEIDDVFQVIDNHVIKNLFAYKSRLYLKDVSDALEYCIVKIWQTQELITSIGERELKKYFPNIELNDFENELNQLHLTDYYTKVTLDNQLFFLFHAKIAHSFIRYE